MMTASPLVICRRSLLHRLVSRCELERRAARTKSPARSGVGGVPLLADSQIQLRVTRARKSAYVRAANRKKQTLAAWAFDALDREAGFDS